MSASHCQGPPDVRHANQVLLSSTRKEFALLISLAVHSRRLVRTNLSEQFWPESDAMHGRVALRVTLLHLLGEGADSVASPPLQTRCDRF